jgi:PhnB protein
MFMTQLNCYLNFDGRAEEAFNFYKRVFGGDFAGGISRYRDVPDLPGKEHLSEQQLNYVMHVALPLGNNMLMASDVMEGMGHPFHMGNNVSLSLHPDSKEEADRLFNELSSGGQAVMPMQTMFWGDYWGMLIDRFGINWMVNYHKK